MWTGALADLRVYPSFGQDLYVRLAAADLGTYSYVSLDMHYFSHIIPPCDYS
jgi:hypothetical protein